MASSNDNISMAVFCDFENVALGVRDANYEKFDIKPVLERLLLKGSIVVKKAYCDWERYKGFKATMHEANFELIEIPHVRQSGKNSADIRLVVDALDLCYTKSHVNTFVIISGDSDFSPLVSKLRENAKQVIGVGVKQSTSDLLVANCDEFIFYDDLVREVKRAAAKRDERKQPPARKSPDEGNRRKEEIEARKAQAIELVVEMFDALVSERGDSGKIWASLLKDTLKRRRPDFNETYYGFRTFGNLLEEAQNRGMLEFGRDEKSGAYVYRSAAPAGEGAGAAQEQLGDEPLESSEQQVEQQEVQEQEQPMPQERAARTDGRNGRGRGRGRDRDQPVAADEANEQQPPAPQERPPKTEARRGRGRGGREQGASEERLEQQPPLNHDRAPKADARRGRGRGAREQGPADELREQQRQYALAQLAREAQQDELEQRVSEPQQEQSGQPRAEREEPRRGRGRGGRSKVEAVEPEVAQVVQEQAPVEPSPAVEAPVQEKRRAPRKAAAKKAVQVESAEVKAEAEAPAAVDEAPAKKPARARRPAAKKSVD